MQFRHHTCNCENNFASISASERQSRCSSNEQSDFHQFSTSQLTSFQRIRLRFSSKVLSQNSFSRQARQNQRQQCLSSSISLSSLPPKRVSQRRLEQVWQSFSQFQDRLLNFLKEQAFISETRDGAAEADPTRLGKKLWYHFQSFFRHQFFKAQQLLGYYQQKISVSNRLSTLFMSLLKTQCTHLFAIYNTTFCFVSSFSRGASSALVNSLREGILRPGQNCLTWEMQNSKSDQERWRQVFSLLVWLEQWVVTFILSWPSSDSECSCRVSSIQTQEIPEFIEPGLRSSTMKSSIIMILLQLGLACGLPLAIGNSHSLTVTGTPFLWSFKFSSEVYSLLIAVYSPSPSITIVDGVTYDVVTGKYYGCSVQNNLVVVDPPDQGATYSTQIWYNSRAVTNNNYGFPVQLNEIYYFCVYPNVTRGMNITGQSKYCGNYHTFDQGYFGSVSSSVDRHIGLKLSNFTFVIPVTTNDISFSFRLYGSVFQQKANLAMMAIPSSNLLEPWKVWMALGIGRNYMQEQDMVVFDLNSRIGDYFTLNQNYTYLVLDNSSFYSQHACSSSTVGINAAISAYYNYAYAHFARNLTTDDYHCDGVIVPQRTQLCMVFKLVPASVNSISSQHDGFFCTTLFGPVALSLLLYFL